MPLDSSDRFPFDVMEIDRLLTTTKAVRRRLDFVRPVSRDLVLDCIRVASYAPNASNRQCWKWVVIDDTERRELVGVQYRRAIEPSAMAALDAYEASGDQSGVRLVRSVLYLADHMSDVPIVVFPCYDGQPGMPRLGTGTATPSLMDPWPLIYGSMYPAVWSFQLALRSRGLGSAFTTAHLVDQEAMADILGIPRAWHQTCLIPLAHTTGGDFSPSPRRPVEESIV